MSRESLPDESQDEAAAVALADEAGIEDLLREVGARDEPSAELTAAVHDAVHAEWRSMVNARQRRRRFVTYAAAAGVVGVVAATAIGLRIDQPEPLPVATIVRIDGHPQVGEGVRRHEAAAGEVLDTGMRLSTDGAARVALSFGNAPANTISVRVDADTQLRFTSQGHIELMAGALYVDAGVASHVPLIVETTAGAVRHVGTQYQVRTVAGSMQGIEVSIREGRVEIASDYGTNTGVAGERVAVSMQGAVLRSPLAADDASWSWATRLAPSFDIAGRPLSEFLDWMSRETGRKVTYDSAATRRAAETLKLGGSIANLDADIALLAVLEGTRFTSVRAPDGSIRIVAGD